LPDDLRTSNNVATSLLLLLVIKHIYSQRIQQLNRAVKDRKF